MKPGRRTLLNTKLQKQICKIIATPCTIRSACEATNVSETAFYSWIRRGEEGERPFAQFAQAVAGARGKGKIKVQRDIWASNDPRVKLELLARIYPAEFGRSEQRTLIVERPPAPPSPIESVSEKRSTDWIDREIPFSKSQLSYIANLRSGEPPSGNDNGQDQLTLHQRA